MKTKTTMKMKTRSGLQRLRVRSRAPSPSPSPSASPSACVCPPGGGPLKLKSPADGIGHGHDDGDGDDDGQLSEVEGQALSSRGRITRSRSKSNTPVKRTRKQKGQTPTKGQGKKRKMSVANPQVQAKQQMAGDIAMMEGKENEQNNTSMTELFKQGDQIGTTRNANLFQELQDRNLTDEEQQIVKARTDHMKKMFEEYEKRELKRKIGELQAVCPDMTEEEITCALKMFNGSEEEAVVALTSDDSYRLKSKVRNITGGGSKQSEQPNRVRNVNRERTAIVQRPYKAPEGGNVFIGAFRGKLGNGFSSKPKTKEIAVAEPKQVEEDIPQWSGKSSKRSSRSAKESSILTKEISEIESPQDGLEEIESKKQSTKVSIEVEHNKQKKSSAIKVMSSPCENSKIDDIMVKEVKPAVKPVPAKSPVKLDPVQEEANAKKLEEATSQTQTAESGETVDVIDTAAVNSKPSKKKAKAQADNAKVRQVADQQKSVEAINRMKNFARGKPGKKPRLGRVRQKSSKRADLIEVGTVRFEKGWHNNGYIFPDGYFAKTPFRSSVQLDSICIHECRIIGEAGKFWPAPTFEIVAQDRPDEALVAKSPTGCWNAILKRINTKIEKLRKEGADLPPPPKTAIAGPEYFGLNNHDAIDKIEEQDQEHRCSLYWEGKLDREVYIATGAVPAPRIERKRSTIPRTSKRRRSRYDGESDVDDDEFGELDAERYNEVNKWNSVNRSERYKARCVDRGDAVVAKDDSNPLPDVIDPITLEPVVNPAISPYGHVMGEATWRAVLSEQGKCPFTKNALSMMHIKKLTKTNLDQYRDRIVDLA